MECLALYNTNLIKQGEITFKIITEKEFTETSWWFSDGTQPISNGQSCYVINEDHDPRVFISCCGNCGDYAVYDMVDHTLEMHDKLKELKKGREA